MLRLSALIWLVVAACAGPPPQPAAAFGRELGLAVAEAPVAETPAPAAAAAPPAVPAAPVASETSEAELRSELATGADPQGAALLLAQLLDVEERLPEALAAVDAGLERLGGQDPVLRTARAGLLRDLGRPAEAARELHRAIQSAGARNAHPGLLFELAELQWLGGDRTAAQTTVAALRELHGGSDWVERNQSAIVELDRALKGSGRPRLRGRDLLGRLRSDPSPVARLRALELLLGAGGELGDRAAIVALADADPLVRAAAVRGAAVEAARLPGFCAAAVMDQDTLVRQAGAMRARELETGTAAAILVPVLGVETDPETFAAIHDTLARCGDGPVLPAGGAGDPQQRSAIAAAWRRRWQ